MALAFSGKSPKLLFFHLKFKNAYELGSFYKAFVHNELFEVQIKNTQGYFRTNQFVHICEYRIAKPHCLLQNLNLCFNIAGDPTPNPTLVWNNIHLKKWWFLLYVLKKILFTLNFDFEIFRNYFEKIRFRKFNCDCRIQENVLQNFDTYNAED